MRNQKKLAGITVFGMLACTGAVWATEIPSNELSLSKPVYVQDTATRAPLMGLLDSAGVAKTLDEYKINIGGLVEASWTYNIDTPDSQTNTGRVFDFEDQDVTFNQAMLFVERAVDYKSGKVEVGGRMEWMWGGDARLIHSNGLFDSDGVGAGPDEQFDLTQAYVDVALPVGTGLRLRAGKFVTLLGAEVINPSGNLFYSHAYLFGYAIPFTNTGVLARYDLSDTLTVEGGIHRGWEQSLEDNNSDAISYIAQVTWKASDKLTVIVGGTTGPEAAGEDDDYRSVLDVIVSYAAADNLKLSLNADYGYEPDAASDGSDAQWFGAAAYGSLALGKTFAENPMFVLNGRVEYFNDEDGARGLGTGVYEATVGLSIKPLANDKIGQNLVIRPEVRWDYSQDDIFNDGGDNSQFTFGIDAYFTF